MFKFLQYFLIIQNLKFFNFNHHLLKYLLVLNLYVIILQNVCILALIINYKQLFKHVQIINLLLIL